MLLAGNMAGGISRNKYAIYFDYLRSSYKMAVVIYVGFDL
jgi:hypothetical protein